MKRYLLAFVLGGIVLSAGVAYATVSQTITLPTVGQLLYSASGNAGGVATTSATCGTGITCTAFPVLGSTNPSFALSVPVTIANGGTGTTTLGNTNAIEVANSTITNYPVNAVLSSGTLLLGTTTPLTAATLYVVATSSQAISNFTFEVATTTGGSLFSINGAGGIVTNEVLPATSTAIVLNWAATGPQIDYQIGSSATTITLINATTSQQAGSRKLVWVCNPSTGTAGAITWVGVQWIGSAPTQTTTAGQCDVWSFDITNASSTTAWKVAGTQGAGFQ